MRLFVAIPLPGDLTRVLTEGQPAIEQVRWVAPDNLHLTLKFIGDAAGDCATALRDEIQARIRGVDTPWIECTGAGVFPPKGAPTVVWAGVRPQQSLIALHRSIDDACARYGIARDRTAYRPHITVARIRSERGRRRPQAGRAAAAVAWVMERRYPPGFATDRCVLFRSDLGPAGPVYTEVASFGFS